MSFQGGGMDLPDTFEASRLGRSLRAVATGLRPYKPRSPRLRLAESYAHCKRITRRSHSSFASAFWLLAPVRRRALYAIYAFCRLADDIADHPDVQGDRQRLLDRWRAVLDSAYRGCPEHPVAVALADAVRRFQLSRAIFVDLLRGVESDLRHEPIETFADLCLYCRRVASTVGLLVVQVLGYRNEASLNYAVDLGIAVQLTNILRDVGEDVARGRVYLAREDLDRMGVAVQTLRERRMTDDLRLLLALYAERARIYYERAARQLPNEDRHVLRPAQAMGQIYRAQLEELQRRGFPCLHSTVRISRPRRVAIAALVWLGRQEAV